MARIELKGLAHSYRAAPTGPSDYALRQMDTAADGILDRLVHNAHRIEMRGDSMRKKRGTQPSS